MPSVGIYKKTLRPIQHINLFTLLSWMDWKLFIKNPISLSKELFKALFEKTEITIDIRLGD